MTGGVNWGSEIAGQGVWSRAYALSPPGASQLLLGGQGWEWPPDQTLARFARLHSCWWIQLLLPPAALHTQTQGCSCPGRQGQSSSSETRGQAKEKDLVWEKGVLCPHSGKKAL